MREQTEPAGPRAFKDDRRLVEALRSGDEAAFASLLTRYHASLLRLAMAFVPSRAVAEEVVQETWLGVLQGIGGFEGRSSLKTWIFQILTNRAKTRGAQERRSMPFTPLENSESDSEVPAVDSAWFMPDGHWVNHPQRWDEDTPEKLLLSKEARMYIEKAIEALPPNQQKVITFRDVEGLSSEEVCNILELSETNQRVLLHRARSSVRRALERYLDGKIDRT